MRTFNHPGRTLSFVAAALATATLVACGGGGAGMHDRLDTSISVTPPAPVVVVPTPEPVVITPAIASFASMVRGAACSDIRNRLFIIDDKQVFWDHAGKCADASYEQVLYGDNPQAVLCRQYDSIAGPQTSCKDQSAQVLFSAAVKSLERNDLGLGAFHTVERVSLTVPQGNAVNFKVIVQSSQSGVHTARNVVVKDADAWARLWAEHAGANGGAVPNVDFSVNMVVGVFLGDLPGGCYLTAIDRVMRNADGIAVRHTDVVPSAATLCAAVINSPVSLAVVERSTLPIDFTARVTPR